MGINSRMGKSNPKLPPAAAGAAAHNAKVAVTLFLCSPWLLASAGHRHACIPAGEPPYICLRERASRELTSAEAFTRRVGPPHPEAGSNSLPEAAPHPCSPAAAGFLFDTNTLPDPGLESEGFRASSTQDSKKST